MKITRRAAVWWAFRTCQLGHHTARKWLSGHICTGCWRRAWTEGRA